MTLFPFVTAGLDEKKDGCYVCLLAYRGRHFQGKTSRATALKLLRDILENWNKLKTVDRLETIRLNRLLESELEASFLEALRRVREGEAERFLSPLVVNGKQGWYLKIPGAGNWLIEPQVELGPENKVSVSSRADFVFHPERPYPGELPIALFTDGFEYHADPLSGNDSLWPAMVSPAAAPPLRNESNGTTTIPPGGSTLAVTSWDFT